MISSLRYFDLTKYSPRCYVIAESDTGSDVKARQFEVDINNNQQLSIRKIPRSRSVGQSWLTTPLTSFMSLMSCLLLVIQEDPDLV